MKPVDDIVERLRAEQRWAEPLLAESADHIEELRTVVRDMLSGLEYLRTTNRVPYGFGIDRLEETGRVTLNIHERQEPK